MMDMTRLLGPWRARGLALAVWVALGLGACARPGFAQAVQPHEALEDAKLYFTAPLHWDQRDWLYFGATVATLAVVHPTDGDIRQHFAGGDPDALKGSDPHASDDALPAAILLAGTWLAAGLIDEPQGWREFGSMVEASAFTLVSTEVIKYTAGRQGPNETADPNQWFASGQSFPSLHTSAAFAIGTVFAESGSDDYRWIRRIVGYGVAGATAYLRVEHNAHWATDVIAGAALGLSTARFTMHRREATPERTAFAVMPAGDGIMLTFVTPLQ
jgi:membrane-associated phospholipid phosphatase